MERVTCPKCATAIPPEGIGVANDLAHCAACNVVHKLSDLIGNDVTLDDDILRDDPPTGVSIRHAPGGRVISAPLGSIGAALGMTAVTAFWNGITWFFVGTALVSRSGGQGGGNAAAGGMDWFVLLFMVPFVLIGLATAVSALSMWFGRIGIVFNGDGVAIRSGIGPFKTTKRFAASQVKSVRIEEVERTHRGRHGRVRTRTVRRIRIETVSDSHRFGSTLSEKRRRWLVAALRTELGA